MTKSELIAQIGSKQPHLLQRDVELAVNNVIETMSTAVSNGERIEIRGFGGFTTVPRNARMGRNPKTGESVLVPSRRVIHFKPGKEMRDRVNDSRLQFPTIRDM